MISYGSSYRAQRQTLAIIFRLVAFMLLPLMPVAWMVTIAGPQRSDLTATEREDLIKAVCDRIEKVYPVEEVGKKTREGLLRKFTAQCLTW